MDIKDSDFAKMRKVEDEILAKRKVYFEEKSNKFEQFLDGRTIEEALK